MKYTLRQISELIGGRLVGNENALIIDVAEIQHAKEGEITFLHNPKYFRYLESTQAEAVIVPEDFKGEYKNLIYVKNPNYAFSVLIRKFRPEPPLPEPEVHKTAVVSEKAEISSSAYVGPYVMVEEGAFIGDNVVVYGHTFIGKRVKIGEKTVGSDGFGFTQLDGKTVKIPQAGGVIIEDDVEIGANCSIDRATVGNTVIGEGTKLDNLIQVGHNVKIGKYCFFAAQTGIAGSTVIEDCVMCGGQVGIAGHLHIGENAKIAAQSGVSKDIPPGAKVFGYPARDAMKANRELAHLSALPELFKKVRELEKKVG